MATKPFNKRLSHGLTLPPSSENRESVVTNILTSLATLDETAQLQWIQETSRQVDHDRTWQRQENGVNGNSKTLHDHNDDHRDSDQETPITGVGYRRRNGSFSLLGSSAPSPAVPMGRPAKQGFFRRFMGIGPKMPIESEVVITAHHGRRLVKGQNSVRVGSSCAQVDIRREKSKIHPRRHLLELFRNLTCLKNLVPV